MKKLYMSVGALLLCATVTFGQNNKTNVATKARLEVANNSTSIKNTNTNEKFPGQVLWSEDFSGGIPAGWTFGGTTNGGADWVINSAAISATFTNTGPILSTSGGNHMLYFGETINPVADRDAYFETTAIPLTGQPSVTVRFEQKFRLCCASAAALNLVVSTDPTFPATAATMTYDARGAVAINSQTADPLVTSINITDLVGGYTGNIYLRFHWALGASHYYWMVDDITVMESVDNDLITLEEYHGSLGVNYTRIPVDQLQPIDFATKLTNVGATDQTNSIVTADVNGGVVFTGTSAPTTVSAMVFGGSVAAATDSIFTTTSWTPPATPLNTPYTVDLTVSSDSVDNTPGNNVFSFPPLEVDAYLYAQDDFGTPGNGGGYYNTPVPPTEDFEAGNYYDIVVNDTVAAIDIVIGTNTLAGAIVDVVLYEVIAAAPNFVQIDRSSAYIVTAGDIGNMVSIPLPTQPVVNAGTTYFAAIHGWGGVGVEAFYGTSGQSPDNSGPVGATSLIFYPSMSAPNANENFFTTNTPMVRMNFDVATGIDEINANTVNFNVYPNPSAGVFNINLDSKISDNVNLTVTNIVGKTIISKTIAVSGSTVETISLTDYSKGVYFVTVNNKTVKLIVE